MQLVDAEKLALELIREFGLLPKWRFEFDDAKKRFGCCHRSEFKITLSRELVLRNDREQVEDTIRHEIAHALCEPRQGHGEAWKEMCSFTGANPERCYDHEEVDAPQGDWSAKCNGCGRMHHKFRRPKRDLFCAVKECRRANPPEYGQGRFNPLCKLVWRHKNALPDPEPSRAAIDAMKAQLKREQELEEMKDKVAELERKAGIKPGEGWNGSKFQAR